MFWGNDECSHRGNDHYYPDPDGGCHGVTEVVSSITLTWSVVVRSGEVGNKCNYVMYLSGD